MAIGLGIAGCADCPHDHYAVAYTSYAPVPARAAATRSATPIARTEKPEQGAAVAPPAKAQSPPIAHTAALTLKPQSNARFVLLENVEAVGGSRSYTGEPSDPNTCAEQCLASSGCDAFAFERETKLCFLVSQVSELTANASFVSGRLR